MELVINRDIENKIKYLCKKIDKVEWSGLVLYTMNGNISDADNMSFIIKDIIPMNVGSACYTEYKIHTDTSDKHIDYCMKHPEALNWKIGGLHSHCSMDK